MRRIQRIDFPGGLNNGGIGTSTDGSSVKGDVAIFRPQRMMTGSKYAAEVIG
jgi:hypothetical protein